MSPRYALVTSNRAVHPSERRARKRSSEPFVFCRVRNGVNQVEEQLDLPDLSPAFTALAQPAGVPPTTRSLPVVAIPGAHESQDATPGPQNEQLATGNAPIGARPC
jgi:hypothetical protein